MGCSHWTKQPQEVDITKSKPNQSGFKSLAYVTSEFDLSEPDSEDEVQVFSFQSIKNYNNPKLINQTFSPLTGLNSANNASTVVDSVINNRIVQTGV